MKLKIESMHVPGLFGKPSLFRKINLKKPLSRGSRFKIYFRFGMSEKSRIAPKFPRNLVFQRLFINKPGSFRNVIITCLYKKLNNLNLSLNVKNMGNINLFIPKNTTRVGILLLVVSFPFFYIFFLAEAGLNYAPSLAVCLDRRCSRSQGLGLGLGFRRVV